MADQRTMAELLQAPTEGYGDAIVTPAILAENFELKHGLPKSFTACPFEMAALTDVVNAMLHHVKTSPPETVKAIFESCVTCGGPHPYYDCLAVDGNTFNASAAATTYNQNQGYRHQGETNYRASNQMGPPAPIDEPLLLGVKPKPFIPYPSRANKQKLREKEMPKFASNVLKVLLNKQKKNCLTYLKTSIVECLALADLGASINLMPLSIWKKLSLPELTPTRMILELAD
ncbi:hypothetical protein Tco_1253629 [Tanacetum coccineum]